MCSVDRREEDAARDELRHELGRERPAGARHLGAAGLEREDGLVGVERPRLGDVAVADRPPVAAQVVLAAARRARGARRPVARCRRNARASSAWAPPGEVEPSTRRAAAGWRAGRASAARRAQVAVARRRREPELHRRSPSRAVERRGSVAEVLTTSRSPAREEPRQLAEAGVDERAIVRASRRAARRRRGRSPRTSGGSCASSAQQGARARSRAPPPRDRARGSGRSEARPRSARAGRARSPRAAAGRRCPRPGTPPGSVCVRMSPGSTA